MDDESIDLRGVLGLLRRRLGLIALATVLAVAIAGIALFAIRPVYTATALVLVDPSKKNLLDPDAQLAGSSSDSLRVDSEVELVKAQTTLLAVASALDITNDPEFGVRLGLADKLLAFLHMSPPSVPSGDEALQQVMHNLSDAVSVQRRGLTFLIAVSAKSERPDFAATIANAVAKTYIRQQLDAKIGSIMQSRDIIEARISGASVTVAQSEQAFDDFIDQNLTRIGEATGRSDLKSMHDRIAALTRSRATLSSQAQAAEQSLAQRDWSSVALSLKTDALASLERQRQELASRLAGLAAGSKDAVNLRASLQRIETNLQSTATKAISGLRQQLASTQAEASQLREQLRSAIVASDLPADILTGIYALQQNAEIARSQYQTLLTRQNDLDTQAFLQVPDSRIASPAIAPAEPSFPNPRLLLGAAAIIGLVVGVALAFLAENFFGGFTSEAQAQSILRVPLVSAVPRQRPLVDGKGEPAGVADAMITAPLSMYAESIRRVRVGIDQALRRRQPHDGAVVMVSSAAPGEGKTTIALSLARAYAQSGLSTLLIDCDLRKPSLHKLLGKEASEGLLDYLGDSKPVDLGSIMTMDAGSGAQIVLGSRRSDIATDQLIAGRNLQRLLAAARKNFDMVILDTPPVRAVVDGLYLAGNADTIVFVVEWSATPQQEVRAAISSLNEAEIAGAPLLAVLNQQGRNLAAYRGRYAGYYAEG